MLITLFFPFFGIQTKTYLKTSTPLELRTHVNSVWVVPNNDKVHPVVTFLSLCENVIIPLDDSSWK